MPIESTPWWAGAIITPLVLGVLAGIGYVFKFFITQAAKTTESFITYLTIQMAENTKERQTREAVILHEREEWLKKLDVVAAAITEHTEYSRAHTREHNDLQTAVKELVKQNVTTQSLILEGLNRSGGGE